MSASSSLLTGRTAVVTGGSSGIGRAIGEKLGAAGAHVYLAGRTREAMDAARVRIEAGGGRATVVVLDVREVGQIRDLVARALRETGRVDIMGAARKVRSAGLSAPGV
jgi:NAD(P)-dependent dehydrogenase (short-subunit alcohol dehydrogenase family)